jgi:hypothetical protein
MDIGTIIAGLQAIASLAGSMNQAPQLTPAQAEERKPSNRERLKTLVVLPLPNQTPPMGVGVPPPPPPTTDYWSHLPPANVLRKPIWRVPQPATITPPVFRGFPPTTEFPVYYEPSLEELYQLYFGTRW